MKSVRMTAVAVAAAVGMAIASLAARAGDEGLLPTVPVRTKTTQPKKGAEPSDDRVWFSINAKGAAGRDSGLGAGLGLSYLGAGGDFVRLQHSGLVVDERGADADEDDDCVFFECFGDAFSAMFDLDLASVTQTELLFGKKLSPDSRWFMAAGVARQTFEERGKDHDEVGAAMPVVLGWSTAIRRSGVGFEILLAGVAGEVSSSVGLQLGMTLGGRLD